MKLIIDIPNKTYNALTHTGFDASLVVNEMRKSIASGTPIPDNATNGDVAELLWGFKPRENTCIIPKTECNGNPAECDGCRFDDWWNAPYQKGGKNEVN